MRAGVLVLGLAVACVAAANVAFARRLFRRAAPPAGPGDDVNEEPLAPPFPNRETMPLLRNDAVSVVVSLPIPPAAIAVADASVLSPTPAAADMTDADVGEPRIFFGTSPEALAAADGGALPRLSEALPHAAAGEPVWRPWPSEEAQSSLRAVRALHVVPATTPPEAIAGAAQEDGDDAADEEAAATAIAPPGDADSTAGGGGVDYVGGFGATLWVLDQPDPQPPKTLTPEEIQEDFARQAARRARGLPIEQPPEPTSQDPSLRARLVGFDVSTGQEVAAFTFPDAVVPPGSLLTGLAASQADGGRYMFFADNGQESGRSGVVVFDRAANRSWRALDSDYTSSVRPGQATPYLHGDPDGTPIATPQVARAGVTALAVRGAIAQAPRVGPAEPDAIAAEDLVYASPTDGHFWFIPLAILTSEITDDGHQLGGVDQGYGGIGDASVIGSKTVTTHVAVGYEGALIFGDVEHSSLVRLGEGPRGNNEIVTLVQDDAHLRCPAGVAVAGDTAYVADAATFDVLERGVGKGAPYSIAAVDMTAFHEPDEPDMRADDDDGHAVEL